ncbi:DNA adenine methylase [Mariniflexile gromovii]|uniref:site-specific DNA-methyltransferase (adenine-specific) n=1 Tax=Mariniflexile gromovii TaxID=362523 RepID=A0ABS4BP88_9FLAO|nr:DNA adenine methylase [Mariniflexile gromovii]MBP0902403.1 hypothetical protein [Mariniflexile gromovii]
MKKYIGNKNVPGVIEFLINRVPKSERYFSFFTGGAGLENSVYTRDVYFTCSEKDKSLHGIHKGFYYNDYRSVIEDNVFTSADFIFCDPPYLLKTRKSKKKLYKYDWETPEHIEFLNYIMGLKKPRIMITHPKCELYDQQLKDWSIEEFEYMTRSGIFKDGLYTNYNAADIELITYECLGDNFIERQAIKRQRKNIVNKFKNMDCKKRHAIIEELRKEMLL